MLPFFLPTTSHSVTVERSCQTLPKVGLRVHRALSLSVGQTATLGELSSQPASKTDENFSRDFFPVDFPSTLFRERKKRKAEVMSSSPTPAATRTASGVNAALALVPLGILMNLGIGTIVHLLKLPVFLDAIGTILVTLLIGWRWGAVAGVLSFLIGGLLVNPVMPWFCGTQVVIAAMTGLLASKGGFRSVARVIGSGILVGIAAGIASAPVIILLFGGITGSGSGVVTAFLLASGKQIAESVILTGISCEPIDKTLQCLFAFWLVRTLPPRIRGRLAGMGHLDRLESQRSA